MEEGELDDLAEKLAEKHVPLKREWLKTCVEYLEQSVGKKTIRSDRSTLENLIIHQFINAEISETYQPLLRIPKTAGKVIIVKRMVFQVQSFTNISIPLYEQFCEATRHTDDLSWFHGTTRGIEGESDENGEKERYVETPHPPKSGNWPLKQRRGMRKLELFDGMNSVNGIEVEEIFEENLLVPGVKIILTGKVKCRRGNLLLDKSNCQLIGGKVDSIKVDPIGKLAKALEIDLKDGKRRTDNLTPNPKLMPLPLKLKNPSAMSSSSAPQSSHQPKSSANNTKISNKSQLNQSTISPFLMKTDRKTGKVTNPEKSAVKIAEKKEKIGDETTENWDFSIEELPPPIKLTPEPPEPRELDAIDANFTWSPQQHFKKSNNSPLKKIEKPVKIVEKALMATAKPVENLRNSGKILEKLSDKWEKRKEKSVEDWTLNSNSNSKPPFEDVPKTAQIRKPAKSMAKKLPEQLLRDDEFEETANQSTEESTRNNRNLEKPSGISKILDKSAAFFEKDVDWDRKGSEEEEVPAKRAKDDRLPVALLPSLFITETTHGKTLNPARTSQKSLAAVKNIHGPRYDEKNPWKRPEVAKVSEKTINKHFPTVKNYQNGTKKSLPIDISILDRIAATNQNIPKTVLNSGDAEKEAEVEDPENEGIEEESEEEMMDEEEQERRIVQSILAKMQYQPMPPPPVVPAVRKIPIPAAVAAQQPPVERVSSEEDNVDESILECTMEKEGREELEKWGLVDERARDADVEYMDVETCEAQGYFQNHPSILEIDDPASYHQHPHYQQSYHPYQPQQLQYPFTSSSQLPEQLWSNFQNPGVKMENLSEEKSLQVSRRKTQKAQKTVEEEMKNKQSDNVQIYRTPFAKRIPSSDHSSPSVTDQVFQRLADLHIVPLGDALVNRKFWMMSKIVVIMPTICHQIGNLNSDGIDWLLKMRVSDTSASDVTCLVSTALLNRIFGFSVQHCKQLFHAKQLEELRLKKAEAERKLYGFQRLDLLIWMEVSPEIEKFPMILDVKTMSDALNIL